MERPSITAFKLNIGHIIVLLISSLIIPSLLSAHHGDSLYHDYTRLKLVKKKVNINVLILSGAKQRGRKIHERIGMC